MHVNLEAIKAKIGLSKPFASETLGRLNKKGDRCTSEKVQIE